MKKILIILFSLTLVACSNKVENNIDEVKIEDTAEIPEDAYLSNSFYLDNKIFVFPFKISDLEKEGWTTEENTEEVLKPKEHKQISMIKDGYKELRVIVYNDKEEAQKIKDINIHYAAGSAKSLGDSKFAYFGEILGNKTKMFEDKEFDLNTPEGKIPEYENEYQDQIMYSVMRYDEEMKFKSFEIMSQEFKENVVLNNKNILMDQNDQK